MTGLSPIFYLSTFYLFLLSQGGDGVASDHFGCDIMDPECRERINQDGLGGDRPRSPTNRCNYQDLWLIPGRADASCSELIRLLEFY